MSVGAFGKQRVCYCFTVWAILSELKWFIHRERYDVTPKKISRWWDSGCGVPHGWTRIQERPEVGVGRGSLGTVIWWCTGGHYVYLPSEGLTETVLDEIKKKNLSLLSKAKILYFFTLQHTRKLNPSRQVLKCKDKHGGSLLMRWKGWQASWVGAVVLVHLQRAAIYYSSRCRASPWLWDLRWARKQGARKKGRRIESGRRMVSKGKVPGSASPRSQQDA